MGHLNAIVFETSLMKRVVIIHYHLNPGGVTRIIESQVQALRNFDPSLEILVLTASCENPGLLKKSGADIRIEYRLNYLNENTDYEVEYNALHDFFSNTLRKDDILHVHNLNLGKNPVLTLVISELNSKGYPVVNHVHDFAEDRPPNYQFLENVLKKISHRPVKEILYPCLENIYYIVLNTSDKRKLTGLGVDIDKISVVPNPVILSSEYKKHDRDEVRLSIIQKLQLDKTKKIVTYPVRVIRRKNIGEFILLAALFQDTANWLVTQPPRNPLELKPYLEWKKFCDQKNISVFFEVGILVDFESLILSSDFCITTSIKEGFGMVYMEPWLFEVPVIGRNLSNITPDLEGAGIVFPLLYPSINVSWNKSVVDFATMSMTDQMQFVSNLVESSEKAEELFSQNDFLRKLLTSVDQNLIDKNKAIILKEFSLENYAKRLAGIYQKFTE